MGDARSSTPSGSPWGRNNTVNPESDVQVFSRLLGLGKQKPFELSLCLLHLLPNEVTESIHAQMANTFVRDRETVV